MSIQKVTVAFGVMNLMSSVSSIVDKNGPSTKSSLPVNFFLCYEAKRVSASISVLIKMY